MDANALFHSVPLACILGEGFFLLYYFYDTLSDKKSYILTTPSLCPSSTISRQTQTWPSTNNLHSFRWRLASPSTLPSPRTGTSFFGRSKLQQRRCQLKTTFELGFHSLSFNAEPELVFVDLLWSPRIDSQAGVPVRQTYLLYRPDKLHRLSKSIPRNRFLWLHKRLQIRAMYL